MVYNIGDWVKSKIDAGNGVAIIARKGCLYQIDGFENNRLIIKDGIGARLLIDPDKVVRIRDQANVKYQMEQIHLRRMAALLGKRGGEATTEAKAAASRENGKRGGRPKKSAI